MTIALTAFRRAIRRPVTLFVLVVLPLLCVGFTTLFTESTLKMTIALADEDNTPASRALTAILGEEYAILEVPRDALRKQLTEQRAAWVLVILPGYGDTLLSGSEPTVETYGFAETHRWVPAKTLVETLTASLSVLSIPLAEGGPEDGGDGVPAVDPAVLADRIAAWQEKAGIDIQWVSRQDDWGRTRFGLSMYASVLLYAAYFLAKVLLEDRESGVTQRIAFSPVPPWRYLLENILAFFVPLLVSNALVILLLRYGVGALVPNLPLMTAAYFLYALVCVGCAVTVVTLCRGSMQANVLMAPLFTFFSMLGGLYWPLEFMPDFMRRLSMLTPPYWLLVAIDRIHAGGGMDEMLLPFGMLLCFALVFFLIGSWNRLQPKIA